MAMRMRDTNITGRTPKRSVQIPMSGARMPEMKAKVRERLSWVWFQP